MRTVVLLIVLAACHNAAPGEGPIDGSGSGTMQLDASPTVDAGPCGLRTGMRGKTSRMVHAGGLDRSYIVYLPDGVDATTPVPLVFVHHGYTMSGQNMYDITGYPALADREHVAVAFPDGQGGPGSLGAPWNVGANVCTSYEGAPPDAPGDDFAFLDAMKADIAQDQCIDSAHVFVTGFSMGGYFAHEAGCNGAGIAGVAPHSGGTHDLAQCANATKPIIMFHGAADPVVPDACDDPSVAQVTEGAAAARWAAHNGCAATTTSRAIDNGTCITYDGCPAGGQVELCTFNAMGHCWAGGDGVNVYSCGNYESATELEWAFWKQNAW
jgi:polyhydroxybutyrate depolymerase